MDQRIGFIHDHLSGEWTMSELCDRYGISRKSGYKWVDRYRCLGASGLEDLPRAPLRHGRATPVAVSEAIVGLRQAKPSWGPRKIVAWLTIRQPDVDWPAASTAGDILKRAGLVCARRLKRHAPRRLDALTVPQRANHVWSVDHKGWVRLGDGTRSEPLTITDGFSRYLISVSATGGTTHAEARPLFERAFRDYGLPEVIRSDNGSPFASTGVTGLTQLSAWWARLGIAHERIDPGHPQQNGRHERFHLTLKEAMHPPAPDRAAQERRFEVFAREYNEERPHEALGQRPPAWFYRPAPRSMPPRPPEPGYPQEAAVRAVRMNGEIRWQGDLIHISWALIGEKVAIEETESGALQVSYFNLVLGVLDLKNKRLRPAALEGGRAQSNPQKL
jgi:transposase InsO family protein